MTLPPISFKFGFKILKKYDVYEETMKFIMNRERLRKPEKYNSTEVRNRNIIMKRNSIWADNWLVNRVHFKVVKKALKKYARSSLLDIGCGEKPFKSVCEVLVSKHIGLEHLESIHNKEEVNIFATAYNTGLTPNSFDTILCTSVLEHLEKPQDAILEMYRVLKKGGHVILTTNFLWHIHEKPRDFFRFTNYGLEYLFKRAGFDVIEIKPFSGFIVTFAQELLYFLRSFRVGIFKLFIALFAFFVQLIAQILSFFDRSDRFTWGYIVIARKPK